MINLIRQIFSPYSNMVKVDFKPLEYIEVEEGKPLIIKLPNEKFIFKTNLQVADTFLKFNTSKNIILDSLENLNSLKSESLSVSIAKISCFRNLIRLLYEITKQEYKGFFKKKKYFKYLKETLLKDIVLLQDIFKKVLKYNSALKKKLENLRSINILPSDASELTAGGQRLQDLIEIDPNTGEKRFKH